MPVSNLDVCARFYSALFDSPGFRVSNGRHYFDCGGVILAVYDPAGDGDQKPIHANAEHVYFAVADLNAFFARAQAAGGLSTAIGDGNLPMGAVARRPWAEARLTCMIRPAIRSASSTSNRFTGDPAARRSGRRITRKRLTPTRSGRHRRQPARALRTESRRRQADRSRIARHEPRGWPRLRRS